MHKFSKLLLKIFISVFAGSTSISLSALNQAPKFIHTFDYNSQRFGLHPFKKNSEDSSAAFKLLQNSQADLDSTVENFLSHEMNLNVGLKIIEQKSPTSSFLFSSEQQALFDDSKLYQLQLNGIEFCDAYIKASVGQDGSSLVVGNIPANIPNQILNANDWPDLDRLIVQLHLLFSTQTVNVERAQVKRCINVDKDSLQAIWHIPFKLDGLPYYARLSETHVVEVIANYFSATGTAKIYDENPKGSLTDVTLENLSEDNKLKTDLFLAVPADGSTTTGTNNAFNFSTGTAAFKDTSVFANTLRAYKYFQSLGYTWTGPKPMKLIVNDAAFQTAKQGGLYTGVSDGSLIGPSINIADSITVTIGGQPVEALTNLPFDRDVVSHEFGHHVIYRTIKIPKDETLVLHEGLADFFTMSRKGNACLGESVCGTMPSGYQSVCYVANKCLRTADNSLVKTSSEFAALEPHEKGQIISGLLWDFRSKDNIAADDVASLAYNAIDLVGPSAGYRDYLLGILYVDKQKFSSKNACTLVARMKTRGFTSEINDVDCNASLPSIGSSFAAQTSGDNRGKGKDDSLFSCLGLSALAPRVSTQGIDLSLILFLFIPLWVPRLSRFRRK